ncbi:hypothetical protein Rhopal_005068-T1 [Rhodotorula paludigena]|uniref:D-aminoacyl-tRNA deacylase n=1 Tax=Rhodotorula paludigena TaxID=86838 RepID=A0AAV5GRC1_9BASI|nr:hypothetical protein Rhopal_005068-T1 [Rhodotorula paludigena]
MRCVLQRCTQASVAVDGEVIGRIGRGIVCFIGIAPTDGEYERQWLVNKLLALKVFPEDREGEVWGWKKSVVDADYEVLCISQFVLYANLRKGAKPDFHGTMAPDDARKVYDAFMEDIKQKYKPEKIQQGRFQSMMDVQLNSDGPCTLILDSATDAPAKPTPKVALTPEQKQKAKEKVAARAKARDAARPNGAAGAKEAKDEARDERAGKAVEPTGAATKSEKELIDEAEQKSRNLAERFKVAMTESYP